MPQPESAPSQGDDNFITAFLRRHVFPAVVALGATIAVAVWGLMQALYVSPRDFQIGLLKDQNAELARQIADLKANHPDSASRAGPDTVALAETGVTKGTSVTTDDGRCTIRVNAVLPNEVMLSTTVDSEKPIEHPWLDVGNRLSLHTSDVVYFIDVHRIRGDIVDLSVHRQKKNP